MIVSFIIRPFGEQSEERIKMQKPRQHNFDDKLDIPVKELKDERRKHCQKIIAITWILTIIAVAAIWLSVGLSQKRF